MCEPALLSNPEEGTNSHSLAGLLDLVIRGTVVEMKASICPFWGRRDSIYQTGWTGREHSAYFRDNNDSCTGASEASTRLTPKGQSASSGEIVGGADGRAFRWPPSPVDRAPANQ
jgi:hypothetical protein